MENAESASGAKVRKPYTITKQRERWTDEEHSKFREALRLHGRAWRKIEEFIGTKTAVQIRSHAQKFFSKVERRKESGCADTELDCTIIPPPRPKRKPAQPYPKKDFSGSVNAGETSGMHASEGVDLCGGGGSGSGRGDRSSGPSLHQQHHYHRNRHEEAAHDFNDSEVTEATVAAVAAAASAAAAAAAAAVIAAAGQHVQAHLQLHPPQGFPFFGMPPSLLAQASLRNSSLEAYVHANGVATAGAQYQWKEGIDHKERAAQLRSALAEATATTEGDNLTLSESRGSHDSRRGSDGDSACSRETNDEHGGPAGDTAPAAAAAKAAAAEARGLAAATPAAAVAVGATALAKHQQHHHHHYHAHREQNWPAAGAAAAAGTASMDSHRPATQCWQLLGFSEPGAGRPAEAGTTALHTDTAEMTAMEVANTSTAHDNNQSKRHHAPKQVPIIVQPNHKKVCNQSPDSSGMQLDISPSAPKENDGGNADGKCGGSGSGHRGGSSGSEQNTHGGGAGGDVAYQRSAGNGGAEAQGSNWNAFGSGRRSTGHGNGSSADGDDNGSDRTGHGSDGNADGGTGSDGSRLNNRSNHGDGSSGGGNGSNGDTTCGGGGTVQGNHHQAYQSDQGNGSGEGSNDPLVHRINSSGAVGRDTSGVTGSGRGQGEAHVHPLNHAHPNGAARTLSEALRAGDMSRSLAGQGRHPQHDQGLAAALSSQAAYALLPLPLAVQPSQQATQSPRAATRTQCESLAPGPDPPELAQQSQLMHMLQQRQPAEGGRLGPGKLQDMAAIHRMVAALQAQAASSVYVPPPSVLINAQNNLFGPGPPALLPYGTPPSGPLHLFNSGSGPSGPLHSPQCALDSAAWAASAICGLQQQQQQQQQQQHPPGAGAPLTRSLGMPGSPAHLMPPPPPLLPLPPNCQQVPYGMAGPLAAADGFFPQLGAVAPLDMRLFAPCTLPHSQRRQLTPTDEALAAALDGDLLMQSVHTAAVLSAAARTSSRSHSLSHEGPSGSGNRPVRSTG